jgi:predicted ATPase
LELSADKTAEQERLFVAREVEMAQLNSWLNEAVQGNGRVGFVTGEAGRGKTGLLAEFTRRAQEQHQTLAVANGICNAFSGAGDPYLPFRQVLSMLAGDVEADWAGGAISRERAVRLWHLAPFTLKTLLVNEQVLIDTFIPSAALARIFAAHQDGPTNWREALSRIQRDRARRHDLEQRQLFEQFYELLHRLAARQPLLLLLDDLQWSDSATINLLFHLGRRLPGSRILIVGAYRPSEVALGRSDVDVGENQRHPLEAVVHELKRLYGEIELDLSRFVPNEGQAFVEALIDSEPNQLDADFRQALFWRTKGHPLFTIELLRTLQEQGDLVLDKNGRWQVTSALSWDALPARVEAVIAQRVGRLSDELRQVLTVASVEGELFTAQVVAQVLQKEERLLMHALSQELDSRHRLVSERDEIEIGDKFMTHYQFRHALFQQYLYNSLSAGERRLLHHDIAHALETLYGDEQELVVIQLAYQFRHAGERRKALTYTNRAAERAETMYAFDEAIKYVNVALTLIRPGEQRETRLALLEKLADLHVLLGQHPQAVAIYQEAVGLRRSLPDEDVMMLVRLHRKIGATVVHMTWFADRQQYEALARNHLEAGLKLIEGRSPHEETIRLLTTLAEEAWFARVHPDWEMAEQHANAAIEMAEELDAIVELSAALNTLAAVYSARGLFRERLDLSLQRLELSRDPRFEGTREQASILLQTGRAMTMVGEFTGAMPYLKQAETLSHQIQELDLLFYALRYQAVCYYRMDKWDDVLNIESSWRALEQQYTNFEERIGPTCFFIALVAAIHALRGEMDESLRLRQESVEVMMANDGPVDGWGRDNHY